MKRKNISQGLKGQLLKLDRFREAFHFGIDQSGEKKLSSGVGTFMTIIAYLMLLSYFIYKVQFAVDKRGYTIIERTQTDYLGKNHRFTAKDGFMLAVGTTLPDGIPPNIGHIEIKSATWGLNELGFPEMVKKTLETHTCSIQELGLTDNDSKARLFPVKNPRVAGFKRRKYLCIDQDELLLYGQHS